LKFDRLEATITALESTAYCISDLIDSAADAAEQAVWRREFREPTEQLFQDASPIQQDKSAALDSGEPTEKVAKVQDGGTDFQYEQLAQVIHFDSRDIGKLRKIIESQSQTRERDDVLADALAISCEKGCHEITHHLLAQEGALPDLPSKCTQIKYNLPLIAAVHFFQESNRSDRAQSTVSLLEHGASLAARGHDGNNVLSHITSGDVIELLLAVPFGPKLQEALSQKDQHGNDALMSAIIRDCESAVSLILIKHGADIRTVDNEHRTTLMNAIWRGRVGVVEALLQDKSIAKMRDRRGRNIWHHVAMNNNILDGNIIKLILNISEKDAGVDEADAQGHTPLHKCAIFGNFAIAKVLLESKRAIVDAIELHESRTALHFAAKYGKSTIIQLLIDHGAERTALSNGSFIPLHLACGCDFENVEAVNTLLTEEAETQLNARTEDNMTPLHIAAVHGHLDIVKALLATSRFTNTNAQSHGGWTALHLACGRHVAERFPSNHPTAGAQEQAYLAIVKALLLAGSDVNARSQTSRTALHLAAEFGHVGIVKLLLAQKDIQFAAKDSRGNTPLFDAARSGKRAQILPMLAPWTERSIEALPENVKQSARDFDANVIDSGDAAGAGPRRHKISVFDLLYKSPFQSGAISRKHVSTRPDPANKGGFRWIHLPANNLHWCHTLLTKHFIEGGSEDVDDFKDLERSLSQQQYRGRKTHLQCMRPTCSAPKTKSQKEFDGTAGDPSRAFVYLPYLALESRTNVNAMHNRSLSISPKATGNPVASSRSLSATLGDRDIRLHQAYSEWKSNDYALHVRRTLNQLLYRNFDARQRDDDQVVLRYLQKEKLDAQARGGSDEMIDAPGESGQDLNVLTVDQLWIWVLGPELVVTSFPQKWQQSRRELPDLLISVLERIDPRTEGSVQSTYELAACIAGQCISSCDRALYQSHKASVLDMFSDSVENAINDEVDLFSRFEKASVSASDWVKRSLLHNSVDDSERRKKAEKIYEEELGSVSSKYRKTGRHGTTDEPRFVEDLLDMQHETNLLIEAKHIRRELGILLQLTEDQRLVHAEISETFTPAPKIGWHPSEQQKTASMLAEQHLSLTQQESELKTLVRQIDTVYKSITDLLGHKQTHASAIEARYARTQSSNTAEASLTLTVLTTVTVIFLPLLFLSTFFTINIRELPHNGSEQQMSLAFIMRNVVAVGLGTALAFMLMGWHHHRVAFWARCAGRWLAEKGRLLYGQTRILPPMVAFMSMKEGWQEQTEGAEGPILARGFVADGGPEHRVGKTRAQHDEEKAMNSSS